MNLSAIGKTLDQPLLISKLRTKTPKLLSGAALAFGIYDTLKAPKEERKKRAVKNAVILSSTVATSLMCAFGLKAGKKQLFKGLVNIPDKETVLNNNKLAVDKFIRQNAPDEKITEILTKSTKTTLNVKETAALLENKDKFKGTDELFDTLFSKKNDLNAKEIFEETGRLSILGLMPVVSGVVSGIAADKITGDSTPKTDSDKIKEGAFQFLANIFMCNVGAAAALFGAEKLHQRGVIKSLPPLKKLGFIMGGIFVTGIMGGSVVANFIGKKILDPIFDKKNPEKQTHTRNYRQNPQDIINSFTANYKVYDKFKLQNHKENQGVLIQNHAGNRPESIENRPHKKKGKALDWLYSERKPEPLDLALHLDDIATAGVLSGFRWIEPMLPLMYTISGYRAGIGYRNNGENKPQN